MARRLAAVLLLVVIILQSSGEASEAGRGGSARSNTNTSSGRRRVVHARPAFQTIANKCTCNSQREYEGGTHLGSTKLCQRCVGKCYDSQLCRLSALHP